MIFNEAKLKFLITATGHLAPEGQMAREVYGPSKNELNWLRKTISGLGSTPTGKLSDLWKQLNAISLLPVHQNINANRREYYVKNS